MTAYMIVDLDVHDPEGFAAYRDGVPALVSKHGGQYIVRGGDFDVLEGEWQPHRMVMFQFPNRQAVHNMFADPDYAELKALRERTAKSNIIVVDGMD
ncbi:MAG: DUF1330 domain-containing protein [Rhodospirillaceae bacterium]|jgi:uncharacterized protein (DUF1330 family)|nr:DUF1330 domain-containing protein [Rhodospirillaceae bacterium]MBT4046174.1 DUF1330 domain-containing protein [Rhodospirillaceae bacterium]MBT4689168.1 DUF1330 domain-containing protein [Rhodospirillaceae bacterium]MBT5080834.1 DUF1330 domain-containing protein [Rhodospirillaceae bacterium]MBT5525255.1 DUF1330 domain-containing protein [Rhodospirillaceae bacterium]